MTKFKKIEKKNSRKQALTSQNITQIILFSAVIKNRKIEKIIANDLKLGMCKNVGNDEKMSNVKSKK